MPNTVGILAKVPFLGGAASGGPLFLPLPPSTRSSNMLESRGVYSFGWVSWIQVAPEGALAERPVLA